MTEFFQQVGITYGVVYLIGGFFFTAIGMLFMSVIPSIRRTDNPYSYVLNAFAAGVTIAVSCFAIVWSRGNSIMWITILLWVFYIFKNGRCKRGGMDFWQTAKKVLKWETLAVLLFFYIAFYFVFYYVFFIRGGGSFFSDFYYYGNAVVYMLETHSESCSFEGLINQVSAYHYGELWLSALAAKTFGLKPIYALLLFAYPVFAFLCMLGMASMCKSIVNSPDWVAAVAGFGALFILPLPSFISYGSLAAHPKNMVMASWLIWGASTYLDKNKILALVIMLMTVPFYSPIAPGMLTLCFCFVVYEQSKVRLDWRSFVNPYTIVAVLMAVFFALFYLSQPSLPYSEPRVFLYEGSWIHNVMVFFVRRMGRFSIVMVAVLIPMVLVLWKCDRERRRVWIALLLCWYISALASCAVAGTMKQISRDGGQIFVNYTLVTTIVAYYLVALCLCALLLRKLKPVFLSIIIILMSLSSVFLLLHQKKNSFVYPVSNKLSDERQFDLLKDCFQDTNPVFGSFYLKGERFYIDEELRMMPNIISNGYFAPYDLSCLQVPKELPRVLDDSHSRALYQYVQIEKQKGTFVSENQSIIDFINEFHIEYLLVKDMSEIPQQYRNRVRLLAQFTDISIYQIVF